MLHQISTNIKHQIINDKINSVCFCVYRAGQKACQNDFKITEAGAEYEILTITCDGEIISIDTCSMEPYIYTILSDIFVVIMCGSLWQLIGYYKTLKTEVNRLNNSMLQQVQVRDDEIDEPIGNVAAEGGKSTVNKVNVTSSTNKGSLMKQYEDY